MSEHFGLFVSIEYKRLSEIRFLRNILAEIDNGHFAFH